MINMEGQKDLLLAISRELDRDLEAYAVGGTAMMLHGIKEATLDIDLVFEDDKDRQTFIRALEKLGYKKMDSIKIYGEKEDRPILMTRGEERFDLFVGDVVYFNFSEAMKKRADALHQFERLTIKAADPHDIIMMKCATDRIKDEEDAMTMIENSNIRWDTIIKEAENQIRIGKTMAAFELGEFLEKLKTAGAEIPDKARDELFKIVKRQAEKKIS